MIPYEKPYENGQFGTIIGAELDVPSMLSKTSVSLVSPGGRGYNSAKKNNWRDGFCVSDMHTIFSTFG